MRDPQEIDPVTIVAIGAMIDLAKVSPRLDDIAQKIANDETITAAEKGVLRRLWSEKRERLSRNSGWRVCKNDPD